MIRLPYPHSIKSYSLLIAFDGCAAASAARAGRGRGGTVTRVEKKDVETQGFPRENDLQCEAPKIAKLVYNSNN